MSLNTSPSLISTSFASPRLAPCEPCAFHDPFHAHSRDGFGGSAGTGVDSIFTFAVGRNHFLSAEFRLRGRRPVRREDAQSASWVWYVSLLSEGHVQRQLKIQCNLSFNGRPRTRLYAFSSYLPIFDHSQLSLNHARFLHPIVRHMHWTYVTNTTTDGQSCLIQRLHQSSHT
ncbi:hypothetical protein A0H81_13249 [Grifola frondosa]|uniref:Uncharacterized protein n=1 Tax=Grifola frondosa TaxID=5627 RepID=A0A1C7LPY7_GRIFR|nr:hypothetical protein A0H81_13249 [Grifola frondosa]